MDKEQEMKVYEITNDRMISGSFTIWIATVYSVKAISQDLPQDNVYCNEISVDPSDSRVDLIIE